MKKTYKPVILIITLLIALTTGACNKLMTAKKDGAANLMYEFSGNKSYPYEQTSKTTQTVVFSGQEMNTVVNTKLGFTVNGRGIANDTLIMGVTIDTLGLKINSMQGNITENVSSIKGKSFLMSMDQKGGNKDLDEAEKITYSIANMQSSNMKASFISIFPGLPEENIQIGYTWQETDTVNISTETENAEIIMTSNNTVEAKENISGYECYKISYTIEGTRDGSSQTAQGLIITNADVSGTGYFYFAVNEGVIVSDHTDAKSDGTLTIPTGESLPMFITTVSDLSLLK